MSERWVAKATGRHLAGGSDDPFNAEDMFPTEERGEEDPGEASRSRFQFLKRGNRISVGGKPWVVVNDLHSATQKFVGPPDYFDVNGATLHIAVCRPDGVVEISKAAKSGVRPVGRVLAKGLLE